VIPKRYARAYFVMWSASRDHYTASAGRLVDRSEIRTIK
jgi:hypothetical protein